MKIAIIGGTGLLGSNLVKLYTGKGYDVKAFSREYNVNINNTQNIIIDFFNLNNELDKYFKIWTPNIIINTIAIVSLQKCEYDIKEAYRVNCDIAKNIASIAKVYNSYFIHISTDHYFNDTLKLHKENDKIVLLNNYAKTKYQAEIEVLKMYSKSLVVRTNIIGFRRRTAKSFFEWLLESIQNNISINLFTNFITSPISVKELGNILLVCYEKQLNGIYNIASSETIDKYSFGIKTANKFKCKTNKINQCEMQNNFTDVTRALTLGLDVSKIQNDLDMQMPTIDETLDNLFQEYMEDNNE